MDVKKDSQDLIRNIRQSIEALGISKLEKERDELRGKSQDPTFWEEPQTASRTMKRLSDVEQDIETWRAIEKDSQELVELSKLEDESLQPELEKQLADLQSRYQSLQKELAFSGPYDNYDAILNLYSGAGGTDAQDWTQMLMRMYVRWAERSGMKASVLDESPGEEAGVKNASLLIVGKHAYGKLRGEHGVHRLVRLSPFNADNLRQTSFAKVEVLPKIDRPEHVPIEEKDLKIDVFRAGGHGGQSVNTTDSAVRLKHLPTGITVTIQNERSQLQNRETAMTILRSKLAQLQLEQHTEKISELKGPNEQAAWGNQIRSYVLHPYTMVKDLRTKHETSDIQAVLDGGLEPFIEAYIKP